jgi:hypothetical protein
MHYAVVYAYPAGKPEVRRCRRHYLFAGERVVAAGLSSHAAFRLFNHLRRARTSVATRP